MAGSGASKGIWSVVLVAVAAAAVWVWLGRISSAQDASAPVKVVFIANAADAFWEIAAVGARDAAQRLNADVEVMMPREGLADQNRFIRELLERDVDGVAISPVDPNKQSALLNQLAKKTLLVTHDSDAPYADRLCYIGTDNYQAGQDCAKLVMEALPDGGTVMIFIGSVDQDNARLRRQGFIDTLLDRPENPRGFDPVDQTLTGGKYTILGTMTDGFNMDKARANAVKAIADNPDLGCMVGMFGYNSPLCLTALKEAGKAGQIKLVAFDEHEATLQGILDGDIHGTLVQDPYQFGYQSVRILARRARGDETVLPLSGSLYFAVLQIRKEDVEPFKAKLEKQLATNAAP
jgi:ribose transport system substrate-binding protein